MRMKLETTQRMVASSTWVRRSTNVARERRNNQCAIHCCVNAQHQATGADTSRRALIAVVGSAAAATLLPPPLTAAAAETDSGTADSSFYATWPYIKPSDILPFIRQRAAPNDAQSVLDALDEFAAHYPMYAVGSEKGQMIDQVLHDLQPRFALEIGTFLVSGELWLCAGCGRLCAVLCCAMLSGKPRFDRLTHAF